MPDAVLTSLTNFTAKPDQAQTFAAALKTLASATKQEGGCLAVNAFGQKDDAVRFIIFERWQSQADLDGHLAGAPYKTFEAKLDDLLAQPPERATYQDFMAFVG